MVSKTDLCGSLHLIGIHVQMWRGYVYATLFSFFGKQPRDNADHWPQADLFEYFSKGFNPTSRSEEYHTKDQVRVKHHENLWNSCSRPTSCCTERWWVLLNYSAVMCPQTCTYLRGFSTLCLSRLTISSNLWCLAKRVFPAGPSELNWSFSNDTGRAKDLMSESLTSYHQSAYS